MDEDELIQALYAIDAADLDYQEWVNVGMALHSAGYDCRDWDDWSSKDYDRYHDGECEEKWETFTDDLGDDGVSEKYIYRLAYDSGWDGPEREEVESRAFGWDDEVSIDGSEVERKTARALPEATDLSPSEQRATQLRYLFGPGDIINVAFRVQDDDPKAWDRGIYGTVDELLPVMENIDFADYGACFCVNSFRQPGRRKVEFIDQFRYGLIESDENTPEEFWRAHQIVDAPVVCATTSGHRSIHVIVRLDAKDRKEHKTRWRMVADAYEAHGIIVDKVCSAPNKMARLAGVKRGDNMQTLISGPSGPPTFEAWMRRHEKPMLPPFGNLDDIDQEIEDDPELVEGVLRYNEVALMTARAKRGKSWAMLDLAVAVATGREWMGHKCAQGDVLYTDPELKPKSFKKRLKKICDARGVDHKEVKRHIVPWNLRGAFTTDGDAPDIVSIGHDIELSGRKFDLVILDSISAFLEPGQEENDNAYVRRFITGHVARIAKATGGAVVMIHHEGKGATGDRSAEDRARGAGAWVDCPDVVMQMSAIYPDNQETEDAMADLGVPYPANTYGRRIECVAIRDNAEFPDINLAFCPKTASFILDKAHKLDDWKVQTSAQIGGKKSGETRKAQAAKRAQEWTGRIISRLQGKDRDAVLTATECRQVVALGLGLDIEDVSLTTLRRYVDQCDWLEVDQTGPRRWGVKLAR